MAKYLVLHTIDLVRLPKGGQLWGAAYDLLDSYTKDCYCSQSWIGLQGFYAGKMACLWEAPSKEAIVKMLGQVAGPPVDAIFDSTMVVDWAEEKKKRGPKKGKAPTKKAKATAKKPTRKK
jgi:hypothetical protein